MPELTNPELDSTTPPKSLTTAEALEILRMTCLRCGHVWIRRTEKHPTVCPKCKSPYWNAPRREDGGE